MSDKYQNKYRNETSRLKSWNYGWNGAYFVTICSKNRERFFGEVIDNKMHYSKIGDFADYCWNEIPNHFPFVKLGEYVVMPNHIHGIVIIEKKDDLRFSKVETQNFASLHESKPKETSQNLGSIIRGFKIGVTKQARKIRLDFQWQARYYDHIIRNQESFKNISEYIKVNPENWKEDRFF